MESMWRQCTLQARCFNLSDFPARASSHLLITKNFSIQDICSTEPLAHVDFYPNGGLSQVLQTPEQSLENFDDDWWAGLRDRLMLLLQWRHCLWLLLPWFRFQNDASDMFPFESFLKKSGKPRCTGLWAWGDNHMRAVELYRESIEASQVWVQGGDHLENPNASWPVKKWDDKKMIDFQGRGTTFLSWKCSFSYQEMIANSESCPYGTSSQLVTFTSMKNFLAFMAHPPSW